MKTVYVSFANHFDLVWRRCWDRAYKHEGKRYHSYREVEEICLLKNLALAERGHGTYEVEQTLTLRAFLEKHPAHLSRLKSLHRMGRFEVLGAGEAIIDVNMCGFETMARNLASGVHYCRETLGMPPLLACHNDGFGSSAQFPQVIRQCGLRGLCGIAYSVPDRPYWRGLDGSTVFVFKHRTGRHYFFDHCYHEPCRVCGNLHPAECKACKGTGLDLPQNVYPAFEPVTHKSFAHGLARYQVSSEEMLPPRDFAKLLKGWQRQSRGVHYRWGTQRRLAMLWADLEQKVDAPPAGQVASRVENNPVQTGCLVSRIRIKQMARPCEAMFYGWEKALALTTPDAFQRSGFEKLFLELPLYFFHDAITGTHQDEASRELQERMAAHLRATDGRARSILRAKKPLSSWATHGQTILVFNPNAHRAAVRVPLPMADGRQTEPWVAVGPGGARYPVALSWHRFSPPIPQQPWRCINATGPDARTRPTAGTAWMEIDNLPPLAWTELVLHKAAHPFPLKGRCLQGRHLRVQLGAHGVEQVIDLATKKSVRGDACALGEILLEEDEGDPWGTRKTPSFCRGMRKHTRWLGTLQFEGYQEAYYTGRYKPSLPFGREQDSKVFALDWYVTVRLLQEARRVDFQYEIFWKSSDRRVRAAFPVQARTDAGYYSIPGGWLKRNRYDQKETHLWSPNGDWPALYFHASLPPKRGVGWALINYGTPSARIADGRLILSLLRSPGFGHCLERYAQDYPMPTSQIRDNGWHHFTLSLKPYDGLEALPQLSLDATALNQAPPTLIGHAPRTRPPFGLRIEGGAVELVSVKSRFDGKPGLILRLLNHAAQAVCAKLIFSGSMPHKVWSCNMTERLQMRLKLTGNILTLNFKPFQSQTLQVIDRKPPRNKRKT